MRNNYEYTKNLARWASEQRARLIYASSAATYGALEADLSDEADLYTLRPLNAYAYSKHLFDLYAQSTGFDQLCGIKYFNVFGPNEDHKGEMRSIVQKAYEQIRDAGGVRLFKSYRPEYRDGEQQRDFIYVKDAVEMTLHLAESGATGLYNVGSGAPHTWLELVRPIFHALELPERIEFIEMPQHLRGKISVLYVRKDTAAPRGRLRSADHAVRRCGDRLRDQLLGAQPAPRARRRSRRRTSEGSS